MTAVHCIGVDRKTEHRAAVNHFLQHLREGNPADYKIACAKGQIQTTHLASGRTQRLRASAFVRRFHPMFLLPPDATGEATLAQLALAAESAGLTVRHLPDELAVCVAEHFSRVVDRFDVYSHCMLKGKEMEETYRDMGIFNCMTGALGVDLYMRNPEAVSLLRIEKDGELAGRALVWKTEQGIMLMDRVHPDNQGPQVHYANTIAEQQGWRTRPKVAEAHEACMNLQGNWIMYQLCCLLQGADPGKRQVDVETAKVEHFSVRLKAGEHYPIFDTFRYASIPSPEDGTFRISTQKEENMQQPDDAWASMCRDVYNFDRIRT